MPASPGYVLSHAPILWKTFTSSFLPPQLSPPYLNVRAPHAAQHKLDYGVGGVDRGQTQLLLSLTRRDSLVWPLWKREAGPAKPLHSEAQWLPAGLRPGATTSEREAKERARIEMHRKSEMRLRKRARLGFGKGGFWWWSYFIYSFFTFLLWCMQSCRSQIIVALSERFPARQYADLTHRKAK